MNLPPSTCLFKHDWITRPMTGRGLVGAYRICLKCSEEETKLYDFSQGDWRWVKGRFVPEQISDVQRTYVFANSQSSFMETIDALKKEYPKVSFVWVKTEADLEEMEKLRCPAYWIPDDWKENPMTDDYRFKRLIQTGHL